MYTKEAYMYISKKNLLMYTSSARLGIIPNEAHILLLTYKRDLYVYKRDVYVYTRVLLVIAGLEIIQNETRIPPHTDKRDLCIYKRDLYIISKRNLTASGGLDVFYDDARIPPPYLQKRPVYIPKRRVYTI